MNKVERPKERIRVLLVDDIAETRENLRKLLSFDTGIEIVGAAASGQEGIELAKQFQPHIVLMDINMPGMDGITATEMLLREVPTAQVVMLSVQGETDYVRQAMLAGARDFLTKPPSGDELMSTIRRVYEKGKARMEMMAPVSPTIPTAVSAGAGEGRREGRVIAVFGPKGGVGCTTIAVNLAIALQQIVGSSQKVALVDTSLQFGDVGVMLNLQASRSIADLAPQIEDLDSDMLGSVLSSHSSGIKALLAPPHPEAAEGLLIGTSSNEGSGGGSKLGKILGLMRKEFDIIVVDTWTWVDETTLTVFDVASLIVLVVMPSIPSIKNARLFLEIASKLDYSADGIALVVNGVSRRMRIRIDQIEHALIPVATQVPLDEQAVVAAANQGVPLIVRDRNRPISQSILHLAEYVRDKLSEVGEEGAREETSPVVMGIGGTGLLRLRQVFEQG
ncbi:MAG: CpaE family protein [Anaerolineae bacterium]